MVRTLHVTCSRLSLRWGLVILLLSVLTMPAAVPRRVLIIHSFGRDFAPLDTMSSAFRTELAQQSPEPVEFFEVSIQSARFAEGGSDAPLLDYLRTLFAGRRLDLIFPVAEPAMHFCVRHRAGFFPETPLLAHVDHRQLPVVLAATNATIIPVYIKIPALMENILHILPDTTNVLMVLGGSPFERLWADQCRREFAIFTNRVAIHYASDLPLAGIRDRVATLPPRSAVLYAMLAVDAAGVPYEQEKALGTIHAAANAPVFGVFESQLGQGILGGPLLSLEDSGKQAAHTALRLLRGVKPGEIAIPPPDPVRFSYDWRELRRWNISEAQLPPGSEVRFRVPTFWEQYKWRLITIHVICLVEALLILGLVRNRQRLRRAQRDLDERLKLEALAAAVGAAFVNLPPQRVDQEIESWMARMIETLDADRIGLFEFDTDQTLARNTHQATRPGVPRHTEEFAVANMRWYLGELRAGNAVILNDLITDLPPAATAEREFARKHGTRAVIGFPLKAAGVTVRAIDCVLVNRTRVWSEAAQNAVRLIGQIFAVALERGEADAQLRASEERLSLATTSARIGVWSWNIESGEIEATAECKQMFGWTAEDVVTFTMFTGRLHPDDRESVQAAIDRAIHTQTIYDTQYRIVLPGGQVRWIAARGRGQFRNGQPDDMLGVVMDITDRRRAEERFRLAVEASPNAIVMVNPSGKILLVNSRTEKAFGYQRAELISQPIEILVPERYREEHPTHRDKFFNQPEARTMGAGRELFARRKDGTEFPVEIGLSPIHAEEGVYVLAAIIDITERRKAEVEMQRHRQELAHVSRLSIMGELSASMAHELNQPLTAILTNAHAAQRFMAADKPDLNEFREILTDIAHDTTRARDVIQHLRALVKKSAPNFTKLDLNETIRDVVGFLHGDIVARNVRVTLQLAADLPTVYGDRIQLQQVMINLLLNSFDAMNDLPVAKRHVAVRTEWKAPDLACVAVCDEGVGIAVDNLDTIFQPFYTTKNEGMGMGLSVSRSIVESHGGRLWAQNNAGPGATFYFTVPVAELE